MKSGLSSTFVIRIVMGCLLLLLTFLLSFSRSAHTQELGTVKLQLKSRPYFQAAGFYTAQAMGFYKEEGLEVRILPGGARKSSLQSVANKDAEYGISDISVLTGYLRGGPYVALASIFQRSPFKLISLKSNHIYHPQELRGRRITVGTESGLTQLQVLLQREGIPLSDITLIQGSGRAEDLLSGNTDVIGVLSSWETANLDAQHTEYNVINGRDYDIDFYGNTLFTHSDEAREHPDRVEAFLRATKKGWSYAMEHPSRAVDFILASGATGSVPRSRLMLQAAEMENEVLSEIVDLGHMNSKRWQEIANVLTSMQIAPRGRNIADFLYDPVDSQNQRLMRKILLAAVAFVLIIAIVLIWNLVMHRAVKKRTRDLQDEIFKRKQAQEQLSTVLSTDQLTGLPNERTIPDFISQLCVSSTATGQYAALLFIDLANFQRVTVTFGRDVSDSIIVEVTRVLSKSLKDGDFLARVGGDQFVIIPAYRHCDRERMADYAYGYAQQIQLPFQSLLSVRGHEQLITLNIGIALSDDACRSANTWIKRAELAMHDSKNAENESIHFFDPASEKSVQSRSALELEIRKGLEQSEFMVYYQLQVDASGRPVGVEALIRWEHPERGMVNPNEFIIVSEESGQIIAVGCWMIDAVCRQLAAWAQDPSRKHLTISVNVSVRQFHHPDFVQTVLDILDLTGANPARLRFEITESIFLKRSRDTINKLRQLITTGISFSLDDFGTGYSSLSYLLQQQLFSEIKIPREFVDSALTNPNAGKLIDSIIHLADSLEMTVVAEGLETEEQRDYLYAKGCQRFQGYLIGRPVAYAELEALLDTICRQNS